MALACASGIVASPAHADEVPYQVRPSLRLGAGWGSDLFLGAGMGSSFQGLLVPALAVDLSVSPRVKLFGSYECALGLYEKTEGMSAANELTLGTRVRLAKGLWASSRSTAKCSR
ncbi:MAG: hypothetical protein QM765_17630 [Myxococcales bacterium]